MTRSLLVLAMVAGLWAAPRASFATALASPADTALVDRLVSRQMAVATGAALVSVPAAFFGARLVGGLSSNLVGAALPAVLAFALVPAAVTAGAAVWADGGRFWPAFGIGVGTQALAFAAAVLLDVSAVRPLALAVFSVLDAAVLATLTVSSLHWFPPAGAGGDLAHLVTAEAGRAPLDAPRTVSGFSIAF